MTTALEMIYTFLQPWRLRALFVATCLLPVTSTHAQQNPVDVLKEMSDRVIAIVDQEPAILDDKKRMRSIADAVVVPHVDFVVFSRWVLGKYWRKATPEQRHLFINNFRELLIRTYLASITSDDYQNQTIHYQPVRQGKNPNKATVEAKVEQSSRPLITVKFRMYLNKSNGWMVYDVVVEGVSLVATHRSSFSTIIREKGMDGLITMLEERNTVKSAGNSSEAPAPAIE
ncbi:MAG: ABC transporter substrate-binding protein [Pseudomonadota bacterium]|nr:ABC transporter substrate-binding protein [Pseudomonadota bacterium]